ncbi:MAG TPA: PQQ-binding-like beta-propeller repeat protein, partial [Pirellulales bacterium]|nr:PQQ-binding-like beta-propeller repeat protein [Pirellulales bacterium]
ATSILATGILECGSMPTQQPSTIDPAGAQQSSLRPHAPAKSRFGLLLVAIFWAVYFGATYSGLPISSTFFVRAGACALLTLLFPIWWLTNRSLPMRDRLLVLAVVVAGGAVAILLTQQTLQTIGLLFMGLPLVFTAWAVSLWIGRRFSPQRRWLGAALAVTLVWAGMCLVRSDGIDGDLKAAIRWRWAPRSEDAYLAERTAASQAPQTATALDSLPPVQLEPGDWPSLRGPTGDGRLRGVTIATDWSSKPPEPVWRERIGPAWSSPIIVAGRLFTQEQVGDMEAVVCLDAASGRRLWSHEDKARLRDAQGGDGPRGTPTYADGCLYTQGATGLLNCLDAADGRMKWLRDIAHDSGAALPMWGFSSSPLVVDGVVITYAGGPGDKGLLAYHADSGEPAWNVATGTTSYSSPELITEDNQHQALLLSDQGLVAVEPASGKICWKFDAPNTGIWRALQPAAIGPLAVLIGSEDLGLVRLDVTHKGDQWTVQQRWASKAMKPGYNDFAVYDGFVYGFDGSIFCCVDIESGKRRWKQGRYGHGQVLLLADEGLLVVTSESGEAVLLQATPEAHRELGRFQAITGKTWNHPVIAHGCLFVRNDEEIACYRLSPERVTTAKR